MINRVGRADSAGHHQIGKFDILEHKFKIGVYTEFAPKRMGEDEIRAQIKGVLGQLGIEKPTPQDKGRIMKVLMPLVKGKADGVLVNKALEERLK